MAVKNIKKVNPYIWIPPTNSASFKVSIITKSGITYDLTEQIISNNVKDDTTDSVGSFSLVLSNGDNYWNDVFSNGDSYYYYKDYALTATTLRFGGFVEKVSYYGNKVKISGRAWSLKFQDITVTKTFDGIDGAVVLKSLIDSYGQGEFTYNNIPATIGVNISVSFIQKNFWECVQDICSACGADCYVDANKDFNLFISGSRINNNEGMVHDNNLYEVSEFAIDSALIINRVIVYGATIDGVQVIYTAEDTTSQTTNGIKEEIVNDENILTYDQAKELADFKLANGINPPQTGDCTGLLLATIQPGQKIFLSSPLENIPPAYYVSSGYEDNINYEDGLFTTALSISKEPRTFSHILKSMIESANSKQNTSDNPESMNYSYTFTFDTDTGVHTNTEIVSGKLKLQSGQTSGSWISPVRALSSNLSQCYSILNTTLITGVTVSVSGNGGIDYEPLSNKTLKTISIAKGTNMYIKVEINDTTETCEIDSLSVQYKLE